MPRDKNVRVRGDLVPTLERHAAATRRSLNAYVTDVLAAYVHRGTHPITAMPLGLTHVADDLRGSVGEPTVWLVAWGGLPPRLTLAAGRVLSMTPTSLQLEVYESQARVRIPRAELTWWHRAEHQDHPVPEIREAVRDAGASPLAVMHLL